MDEKKNTVWKFELSEKSPIWVFAESSVSGKTIQKSLESWSYTSVRLLTKREEFVAELSTAIAGKAVLPAMMLFDCESTTREMLEFAKDIRVNPKLPHAPILPILKQSDWAKYSVSLHPYNIISFVPAPLKKEEVVSAFGKLAHAFTCSESEKAIGEAKQAFAQNNFDKSKQLFEHARENGKKTLTTEVGLIQTHQAKGNVKEAEALMKEAAALDKDSYSLQLLGLKALTSLTTVTFKTKIHIEDAVKGLLPLCLFEERFAEVMEALALKQDIMLEVFEKLRATFTKSPNSIYEVARVYFAQKNDEKSFSCAKEAYNLGCRKVELLNLLGVFYRRRQQLETALSLYKEAVEIAPQDYRVHYNRGLALEEAQQFREALSCYDKVLQLSPNFAKAGERQLFLRQMKIKAS